MFLTVDEKVMFAEDVLVILQDALEEIEDAGSEYKKEQAKLTAYERIRELLKS